MFAPVWRLRGSTTKSVDCYVEPTLSKIHMVTVLFGSETFLTEGYPTAASAMRRAAHVRDGLLKTGTWTLALPSGVARATDRS